MLRFLFILLLTGSVYAQNALDLSSPNLVQPAPDSAVDSLHYGRIAAVASLVGVAYAGSYYLIFKNGWWSQEGNHLHFENDFNYAQNTDKLGHFFCGRDVGRRVLRWLSLEWRFGI